MKSKAHHATNCMSCLNSYFPIHTQLLLENSTWSPGEGRAEGDEKSKQSKPEQYSVHGRHTHISDPVENHCTVNHFSIAGKP